MVKTSWPSKTLFHTHTHTLPCTPGESQVSYRVQDPFVYQMGHNITDTAIQMGLMNGIPWLTSPVIMTGPWVHAAKLTH